MTMKKRYFLSPQSSYCNGVRAKEATEASRAILNGKGCVVLLVGLRLGAVVLVVQQTGNIGPFALFRGNPEIG